MRLLAVAALAGLLATAAHADTMKNCAAVWKTKTDADKASTTYAAYSKVCLKKDVKADAVPAAPAGATAVCNDGSFSKSTNAKGRCSSHGGVAKVLGGTAQQ